MVGRVNIKKNRVALLITAGLHRRVVGLYTLFSKPCLLLTINTVMLLCYVISPIISMDFKALKTERI